MSNPPDQQTTQELIAIIHAWIRQAGFSESSSEYRPRLRINMQAGEFMLPSKGESIRSARATRVEKGREAWLLVHDDSHGAPVSRAIELRNQKTVFGRAEDADIRLVNPEVSRHHFCIEWLGTHVWQIRDLGSGTVYWSTVLWCRSPNWAPETRSSAPSSCSGSSPSHSMKRRNASLIQLPSGFLHTNLQSTIPPLCFAIFR
jgi:hypothetical protein